MQGVIKVTAFLKEPEGVWEDEIPVQFPPGKAKAAALQVVMGIMAVGLIRTLGEDEFEIIPMLRVKSITAKTSTILGADGVDLSQAVEQFNQTSRLVKG